MIPVKSTPKERLIEKMLKQPELLLGPFVGLTLFTMMAVTFTDVIGRYAFNAPLPGGLEITEYLMATVIFLGLPLLTAEEGHVTVDLFEHFFPPWLRHIETVFVNAVSFITMSVLCWRLWLRAGEITEYGDITAFLELPLGPLVYFMCLMVGLTSVIMLLIAIKNIGQSFTPITDHSSLLTWKPR
jgi:TRAP-type C4-dicarboxylate transport system permease small subunit